MQTRKQQTGASAGSAEAPACPRISVQVQLREIVVDAGEPLLRVDAQNAAHLEGDGLNEEIYPEVGIDGRGTGKSASSTMSAPAAMGAVSLSVMATRRQRASRAICASTQDIRE